MSYGVSVIVYARFSNARDEDILPQTYEGNDVVLRKFTNDFIAPVPVIGTESVVWNGRKAWVPLPWAATSAVDVQAIGDDFNNEESDVHFCEFLKTCPANSTIYILQRGVDGASAYAIPEASFRPYVLLC
jgi:hypothetical protein